MFHICDHSYSLTMKRSVEAQIFGTKHCQDHDRDSNHMLTLNNAKIFDFLFISNLQRVFLLDSSISLRFLSSRSRIYTKQDESNNQESKTKQTKNA